MDQENQLVVVIKESGLDTSKSDTLMKSFVGFYSQAKEVIENCKSIEVTDESQKDLIQTARDNRLKLKNIRVECENTRKQLKEQSLREGKAIDGISNVIKALIIPVEEHLEKQEKFVEIKEQLRLEKQLNERIEKLSQYVNDVSLYNLKDMADEVFENLLSGCKVNFEKAQQEQKEAEEKEKQRIESENKLRNRQIEIAPYRDFVKEEITINMEDKKYNEILNKAKEDKKNYDIEQEKIRIENKKLQDKINADKIEKEKQDKIKADEQARIDAENKVKEEEEKKKLLAPDKEKILDFAIQLSKIQAPAVKSNEANQILSEVLKIIITAVDTLQNGAKKL